MNGGLKRQKCSCEQYILNLLLSLEQYKNHSNTLKHSNSIQKQNKPLHSGLKKWNNDETNFLFKIWHYIVSNFSLLCINILGWGLRHHQAYVVSSSYMSLGYFSIPENIFHFYHFLHRGGGSDIYSYTSICIFFLKQGTKSIVGISIF